MSIKQILIKDPKNKHCIDCGNREVRFVSINNGVTLCELCAENHKNILGNNISFVRNIEEPFDDYLVKFFEYGGNRNFKKTLRKYGVDLDMKKMKLYKTKGVDYYRRKLKAVVKGEDMPKIDFDNPNEINGEVPDSFPEFR